MAVPGSTAIYACFAAFGIITIALLFVFPTRKAALIAYFTGWLLLPVASFPANLITKEIFTVEVIGAALPSNIGLTKAVIIPLAIILGLILRTPSQFKALAFGWLDLVVTLFCLWPLMLGFTGTLPLNSAALQAGYMCAAWGGSWIIGRLFAQSDNGQRDVVEAIAWSGVPLLPIAVFEGIFPPSLYSLIYGFHPFQLEGAVRYFGFRPMGLLEHGNQFGIWIAMSALAWFAMAKRTNSKKAAYVPMAIVMALASLVGQSVGAIALLGMGAVWLSLSRRVLGVTAAAAALVTMLFSAVYLSGTLPVARSAWESVAGGKLTAALQATGRGSLGYRVRRDQMALPLLRQAPLAGYGKWDWWRPLGSHPWGLPLLIAGQFGIIAFALAMIAMAGGAVRSIWHGSHSVLPIIVLLGLFDAWLNSYIYWPGLLAAGALSSQLGSRRSAARSRATGLRTGEVASAPSNTSAG